MAPKSQQPQLRQANLSLDEKRKAIQKIERRIADIDVFDVDSVNDRSDPRIDALETKLNKLLSDVFGVDTYEYNNYRWAVSKINTGPINMMYQTPIEEIRYAIKKDLKSARSHLEAIKEGFIEDIESEEPTIECSDIGRSIQIQLHPIIKSKCEEIFWSGHYSEAVEKGFKVVKDRLRDLTGFEKGSDAFGRGSVHVEGAAAHNVEEDFNSAAKFLMMSIDMFRNEKSHTSDAKIDDPNRASHYLALSSLAMYLLDGAKIRRLRANIK